LELIDLLLPTWGRPDLSWTVALVVIGIIYYVVIEPRRKGK
jgi:hypothetical protein